MIDDGYIKFNCNWEQVLIEVSSDALNNLNSVRSKLVGLNMIGKIPNGPGFGNISFRNSEGFVISGSNTGHFKKLNPSNLALVNKVDTANNTLSCIGGTIASSESMTHAVIYKNTNANAVIHIHHKPLWETLKCKIPTTSKNIAYGTPEMAFAIEKLIKTHPDKIFVLGGHEDGIITYGNSLKEAYIEIVKYC